MSYKLPKEYYQRKVLNVDLLPSKSVATSITVHGPNSRIEVHYYPAQATAGSMLRLGIGADKASLFIEALRVNPPQSAVISLRVRRGLTTSTSAPHLSNPHYACVKLSSGGPNEAEVRVENITIQPLRGTIVIRSVDAAGEKSWLLQQRAKQLKDKVSAFRSPEALLGLWHTIDRHLERYPGGLSDFERVFSNGLARAGVNTRFLESIAQKSASLRGVLLQKISASPFARLNPARGIEFRELDTIPTLFDTSPLTRATSSVIEQKYRIWIGGIKSLSCADDMGWEVDCDKEEPFVVWTANAPNFMRSGATEQASVSKSEEFLFREQTNVMSDSLDSPSPIRPETPLIFLYQVIEKDDDQPTKDDYKGALSSAFKMGLAIYKGDYEKAGTEGIGFLVDMADILMRMWGGGDDLYPVMGAFFNQDTLLSVTSGALAGPLDAPMFQSGGDYNEMAIRTPQILDSDGAPRWTVLYFILRQPTAADEPAPPEVSSLPWLVALMSDKPS